MRVALIQSPTFAFSWWATAAPATTTPTYAPRIPGGLLALPRDTGPYVIPGACRGLSLIFNSCNTPLATDTLTATIVRAPAGSAVFADTTVAITIPASTAAGTSVISLPANAVSLAAGDLVALKMVQSGTTAQTSWFASFTLLCG